MEEIVLRLTGMANGGAAVGRDDTGRPVFVPYAIPGETVRVRLTLAKNRYAWAELLEVLEPSPHRVEPRCPHFGLADGCHLQHIAYEAQLQFKEEVVRDQLQRIGGLKDVRVWPALANPTPWQYGLEMVLSPAPEGGLGYWSSRLGHVVRIDGCYTVHPRLLQLYEDVDLELPQLRRLTLRLGDGDELLAALEVEDVEPPELEVDFPVSVAIVLPDGTAASLIGDPYLVQVVKGCEFRVSPGSFFYPSLAGAEMVIDTVLAYARLTPAATVLELYSGVGTLTRFLAAAAAEVVGIEANPDAVADAAANLEETDNVSLYEGLVEDILPALALRPDVVILDPPPEGLSREAMRALTAAAAPRLVYVSSDVATMARDGKQLDQAGYRLLEVQPLDVQPQTFFMHTVSLWQRD